MPENKTRMRIRRSRVAEGECLHSLELEVAVPEVEEEVVGEGMAAQRRWWWWCMLGKTK